MKHIDYDRSATPSLRFFRSDSFSTTTKDLTAENAKDAENDGKQGNG